MMAGYSGKPLGEKLGIKKEFTIVLVNPPKQYMTLVAPLPEGVTIAAKITNKTDLVHLFTTSKAELSKMLRSTLTKIKQDAIIWVSWPKKSSNVPTDITEDRIRDIALPLGLVDIKVCAVDEVWSGLKLVIRKENRK
ncbi:MAG: DUF3052 family protein [Bacteroidota bacterium]|nr:DUF3052 family protein [Bacteroidota bacterium]